ncbi:hypothetical protein H632_c2402p0, partial [Helicosporidium sp. ATCC 50920]
EVLNSVCKEFTKEAGRKNIVGFGNWSNDDSSGIIQKCPAGPFNALQERLRCYCPVASNDEHRTSHPHHRCHVKMDGQGLKKAKDEDAKAI